MVEGRERGDSTVLIEAFCQTAGRPSVAQWPGGRQREHSCFTVAVMADWGQRLR